MADERIEVSLVGVAALEHQTGPSQGTITWLSGSELDVSMNAARLVRVGAAGQEDGADDYEAIARLRRIGDTCRSIPSR